MNFSSIPAYLDPSNWQQQAGGNISNSQFTSQPAPPPPPLLPPPLPPPPQTHVGGAGSIRPGSMADRARLANVPMPETALKCPRCESTNTKFCYFNNYSLTQPRHFCKTCRRYWTRGGAMRNVPVGGGCRRNKRVSKNSSSTNNTSKSPASSTSTDGRQANTNSGSTTSISSNSNCFSGPTSSAAATASLFGLMNSQIPPLRFMSPLGQFTSDHHHHHDNFTPSDITYVSSSAPPGGISNSMNFQLGMGGNGGSGMASLLTRGDLEQWRMQQQQQMAALQFPNFMGGLDQSSLSSGLYPFQGGLEAGQSEGFVGGETSNQIRPKISNSMLTQLASVKMEDNHQNQSNLSRQLLGITGNDQNWSTAASAWTDLSASFSSSSTSNPL